MSKRALEPAEVDQLSKADRDGRGYCCPLLSRISLTAVAQLVLGRDHP